MSEPFVLYLGLGLVTGVLSGLLGIGGGVVMVPCLYWGFGILGYPAELRMIMAVATSLATIVPTSMSSGLAHHRRGYVDWPFALKLAPGILLGTVAGASMVQYLPTNLFKLAVAVFQLLVAVSLIKPGSHQDRPAPASRSGVTFLAGCVTGGLSAMVGIGGGTLSVPFMLYRGLTARHAVATASVCGFPIALVSTAVYTVTGWHHPDLPAWNLGYVHLPAWLGIALTSISTAPLGAWLAHRLPTKILKRGLGLVIGAVGLKLLTEW